ncbi:hypothetical protein Misp06_04480 [Microbulbifer sp. NBRC 101763]|uniref:hypothetical protein n=1 Tax=unclassified Microbulbifer TaxID=2619833 RepID=UPI00309C7172
MSLTIEQEIARTKKLVSAAKSVVSGQVGITIGSKSVSNKLYWLGPEWEERYPIFKEFHSALPLDIPVGVERLEWNPDLLLELDPVLAEIEFKFRPRILEACIAIIKQHD